MGDKDGQTGRVPLERIGVAGIWCRDGQVLLTRRAPGISYGNLWCFPGGGIDPGEDEVQALHREWREELGTSVRLIRKIGSSEVSRGRFLLHWYLVEGGDEPLRPNPSEVAEVGWFVLTDVLSMPDLLQSNRQLLEQLVASGQWPAASNEERGARAEEYQGAGDGGQGAADSDRRDPASAAPPRHCLYSSLTPRPSPPASGSVWHSLQEQLEGLRRDGMYRTLRTVVGPVGRMIRFESGQEAINFASNDYLGLAGDERIAEAAAGAASQWGWGAGASRLVSGHSSLHAALEAELARFKGSQAAIVLPTGYMTNLAVIRTLAGPDDVILLDKLDHASIIDAAMSCGAQVRVFPHRNYTKLESLLKRYAAARRRVIVTDTIFSMDGDVADLGELVRLKRQYDALLVVDEAHATGVLGRSGRGLAELQDVEAGIDVTVGTLSKAFGGIGGFVTGPRLMIEAIVNLARPFIFTTGMPAAACAAAIRAIQIVQEEPQRRRRALALSEGLRRRLSAAGWDCGDSQTQIVPVIVGPAPQAVALSERLLERGFFAPAIRPPAVPPDGSRLRISVTAAHTQEDVDGLAEAIGKAVRA